MLLPPQLNWLLDSSLILNLRLPYLLSSLKSSNNQHTFFDLIAPYIPPSSLRSSLQQDSPPTSCLISDQKWAANHLISKVSSSIVINSLHNVSSDFNLHNYNGPLSSMHILYHLIFAEYLDCMHGRDAPPPMSSSVEKTGAKLINIIK